MNGWYLAAMSLSLVCVGVQVWCLRQLRRQLAGSSVRSLTALSVELADLASAFESLHKSHTTLYKRISMRELRAQRKESSDPSGSTGEDSDSDQVAEAEPRDAKLAKIRSIARARGLL